MSLFETGEEFPPLYESVLAVVRKVLREDWDPIGVGNLPGCYDEYDSYAPGIATMLMHEVSDEALDNRFLETLQRMGLATPDRIRAAREIRQSLRSAAAAAVSEARDESSP